MNRRNIRKSAVIATAAIVIIAIATWLAVPTASINPGNESTEIPLGNPLQISSSALATIGKVVVTVDDKPLLMEYNLESGDIYRELDLKPGQEVRIETKIASAIGVTREFVSTFKTVSPVIVDTIEVNGTRLSPGGKIPPQSELVFSFNKPVNKASVSLDGSEVVELQIDESNPSRATLPAVVSLKQGVVHVFKVMAEGAGSGVETESGEIRTAVVKPLTLYGKAQPNDAGGVIVELDASVAFRDPEAVKAVIGTDMPDAVISVERQKIMITSGSLTASQSYTIAVGRAEGIDGSFLEGPMVLTLDYKAGETQVTQNDASSGYTYSGYNYSGGSAGSSGGGGGADSGPPPGWPPCCPWPPR
ncbi:MAG: hypothetical protein WC828_07690 [Thermoleophilia bacterium]|jgi:hypothetical protein